MDMYLRIRLYSNCTDSSLDANAFIFKDEYVPARVVISSFCLSRKQALTEVQALAAVGESHLSLC